MTTSKFFNIISYFNSPNKTYKVTVSVQLLNDFDQLSTFWGSFSAKNYPFLVISDQRNSPQRSDRRPNQNSPRIVEIWYFSIV